MPVRQPPSLAVKFGVAAIFLCGIGFGTLAALSQPDPVVRTIPTPVEVARVEPKPEIKPEPKPVVKTPATKPEAKTPVTKPEPKLPDPVTVVKKPEPTPEPPKPAVTYSKVKGILQATCVPCHGDPIIRARIDMRSLASIQMKRGLVVAGKPDASDMWGSIDAGTMPPPDAKTRLTDGEKNLIRQWITDGAKP